MKRTYSLTQTHRPIWSARCKSGFQFGPVDYAGRPTGKMRNCNRSCARGQLLCSDCLTAEVMPAAFRQTWQAKLQAAIERRRMARLLTQAERNLATFAEVAR